MSQSGFVGGGRGVSKIGDHKSARAGAQKGVLFELEDGLLPISKSAPVGGLAGKMMGIDLIK